MRNLLAALLLAPLTAPPAITPTGAKPFYRAHFKTACADWRESRGSTSQEARLRFAINRLWIAGYVSAYNVVGPDRTGDLLGTRPWEDVYAFVDRHCARHPSHQVVDAMQPLALDFVARRPKPKPAPDAPPPGSKRRAIVSMWTLCSEWTGGRDNALLRIGYGASVRGYLTAYNLWGPDPSGDVVGAVKDDLLDTWFDRWCLDRPRNALIGGIAPLLDHLKAERAAGRLPPPGQGPGDEIVRGSVGRR